MDNNTGTDCPDNGRTRFFAFLTRHKVWLAFGLLLLTAGSSWLAAQVKFDSSIRIWFLEDDRDLATYDRFLDRFAADEVMIIGAFSPQLFSPANLKAMAGFTQALEDVPFVHAVQSLTNIRILMREDDAVFVGDFYQDRVTDAVSASVFRDKVLAHPLLRDGMVSTDGKAAAIVVEITPEGNDFAAKTVLVQKAMALAKQYQGSDITYRWSGTPYVDEAFQRYSVRDYTLLSPLIMLLVSLIILFLFRHWTAVLFPATTVILANIITFAAMAAMGWKINIVSSVIAGLVVAVGVADSVHMLSAYLQRRFSGEAPRKAALYGSAEVTIPCLFTSLTTAAGFLSLLGSELKPMREFGMVAAFAVLVAFVLSLLLAPLLLPLYKPSQATITKLAAGTRSRILGHLGNQSRRQSRMILAFGSLLLVAALLAIPHMRVGANVMNYFRPGDPVRQNVLAVDKALGGGTTIEFDVLAGKQTLKDPATLRRLNDFENWLKTLPGVTGTLSLVDILKDARRVFRNDAEGSLPKSTAESSQYLLLMEGEEALDRLSAEQYRRGRITARVSLSDSSELVHRLPEVERELTKRFPDNDLHVTMTGYIKLIEKMETYLISSQIESFLLAFVVVSLLMILLLRSLRIGLLAMVPNLTPVLCGLGFMAIAGIELDAGTVMIAGIALGLVVDDTVHLLYQFGRRRAQGLPRQEAIAGALAEAGRPVVATSLILMGGFVVLAAGSFNPNVNFGLVTSLVIFMALLADLFLLPALILLLPESWTGGQKKRTTLR